VGNRVSVFDLVKWVLIATVSGGEVCLLAPNSNKSYTFPFENRKNITTIALSPDSNILLSVDEGLLFAALYCLNLMAYLQMAVPYWSIFAEASFSTISIFTNL
jgi:hypothetical protein